MSRVVVITGAAGGIGRACVHLFRDEGWEVFGVDLVNERETSCECFLHADVSSEETWQRIAKDVEKRYTRLDAVVNNAAIQICKPLVEMSLKEWEQTMAVNLRPAYFSAYHLHPFLKNWGGAIVNVSSVHALVTSTKMSAYVASKGALTALTRAMAVEFAEDGIRVNAVLPGAVDTPMLRDGLTRGHLIVGDTGSMLDSLARKTVLGRVGDPAEIARGVLFLADSVKSSFVTGHCLVIDGGATARLSTE